MKSIRRKGFTLVELLIVIVVIGILSAMMMLSSTEAVSSAKASNVVSNLRNIKTAVLSWYADNLNRVIKVSGKNEYHIDVDGTDTTFTTFVKNNSSEIMKYLSSGSSVTLKDKNATLNDEDYILIDVKYKDWYVVCKAGSNTKLKEKLAAKAGGVGLVGFASNLSEAPTSNPYNKEQYAGMLVLHLSD